MQGLGRANCGRTWEDLPPGKNVSVNVSVYEPNLGDLSSHILSLPDLWRALTNGATYC